MSRKALFLIFSACICAFVVLASIPAFGQARPEPLVKQKIEDDKLVRLAGNTRPEVRRGRDRGAVSDNLQLSHMYLQMRMPRQQENDAETLISRLHDPASPDYHKWLSVAEIEDRFGPSDDDLRAITNWLEGHGFTVNVIYRANGVIDFSGPAGSIRKAFHTEIHHLEVNGQHHIANISDPQIPVALAAAVHGVISMHDFHPHNNRRPRQEAFKKNFTTPDGVFQALVPGDLATIYDINPVYKAGVSGKGQTIVVVEDGNIYSAGDWHKFRHAFGLDARFPSGSLKQIHPEHFPHPRQGPTCDDPGINGADGEAAVDMEWATAAAPGANIVVASCADTNANFGGFIAIQNLITSATPPPGIISISYGISESEVGPAFNAYTNHLFRLAVLQGVSIYVSSGDAGADTTDAFQPAALSGINVSSFATTAHAVAVGGTDFSDSLFNQNATYWNATNGPFFQSAKSYIPEMPWDDSCANVPLANFLGFPTTYGSDGLCNNLGDSLASLLNDVAGSGGPSACFTGAPDIVGVVGGTCKGNPKPLYQFLAAGNPHDGVRDIPDISMFASNGFWGHYYVYCYTNPDFGGTPCTPGHPEDWAGAGGTSFGAPIMAGVQALINESVGSHFDGNPNYSYYALNAFQHAFLPASACDSSLGNNVDPHCIYHDVTFGDIDVNCLPLSDMDGTVIGTFNCYIPSGTNGVLSTSNNKYEPAYPAKRGYDFASGMGSVDVFNLLRSWPGSKLH